MFLVRRVLLAAALAFIPLMPVQILFNQILSVMIIAYLSKYDPMLDKVNSRMEYVNEASLVFITDTIFLLTDFIP
jgi:hypothetical protein